LRPKKNAYKLHTRLCKSALDETFCRYLNNYWCLQTSSSSLTDFYFLFILYIIIKNDRGLFSTFRCLQFHGVFNDFNCCFYYYCFYYFYYYYYRYQFWRCIFLERTLFVVHTLLYFHRSRFHSISKHLCTIARRITIYLRDAKVFYRHIK